MDAWKQYHDLLNQFTQTTEVRSDITVMGHACDRSVELVLEKPSRTGTSKMDYLSTGKRNVGTMRELGEALLAACDFVEANNPVWASKGKSFESSAEWIEDVT